MLRSNTCGDLRKSDVGKEVTLCGWVQFRRDHGGKIFYDLRDRYGLTQVVFDPVAGKDAHANAEHISRESTIQIKGKVSLRPEGMSNKDMPTGDVEVVVSKVTVLGEALPTPIEIDDRKLANEDARLKYRYLDLRRPTMQANFILRHKIALAVRKFLDENHFLEVETPLLIRSTPEGARDYVVPSRVNPGQFYSLPQSPQLYKQILMVAGFDRYFQLAKCLRDEDLRSDRQPEFTQIDVEMSFMEQDDVLKIMEGVVKTAFAVNGIDIKLPLRRMKYMDAMNLYGSDKPDLRFGLEFKDVTDLMAASDFTVFKNVIAKKGVVKCLCVPGGAKFSRGDMESLVDVAKLYKASGLAYMTVEGSKLGANIAKYFKDDLQSKIISAAGAKDGDLLCFVADKWSIACTALGQVRLFVGKKLNLIKSGFELCFVVDFPLFEWNDEDNAWYAMHHLFSMPQNPDMLEKDPSQVLGYLYDLVINGTEAGGGSLRIHRADLQERVMKVVGMTLDQAKVRFGFLLEALAYGAPPHGGFAFGLDRLCALVAGVPDVDIREVMAFPKNKQAQCPMDGCPSDPDPKVLKENSLKVDIVKKQ